MYDYTALVDAPVQRFTGIVTGSDPDDERIAIAPLTPPPSVVVPVAETPLIVVAAEPPPAPEPRGAPEPPDAPEPRDAPEPPAAFETSPAEPVLPAAPVMAIVDRRAGGVPRTSTRATTRTATPAAAASRPSMLPALAGIAAVGITAMWWLRRESHDR